MAGDDTAPPVEATIASSGPYAVDKKEDNADYSYTNQAGWTGMYFFLAITMIISGTVCLWIFTESEISQGTVPTSSDGICRGAGYDKLNFTALFFSCILQPAGSVLLLVAMVGLDRNVETAKGMKIAVYATLAPVFFIMAVLSWYYWGYYIMDCGIVGCIDVSATVNYDFYGFMPICGVLCFIASLLFMFVDLFLLGLVLTRSTPTQESQPLVDVTNKAVQPIDPQQYMDQKSSKLCSHALQMVLGWAVFMPFLCFLVMLLPNQWTYFTRYYIGAEAETGVSSSELSTSDVFTSMTISYGGDKYLKIYPDTLMFYSFLYSILVLGVLMQVSRTINRCMHQRLWFCGYYATWCTTIIAALFVAMMTMLVYYWTVDHDWAWEYGDTSDAENWARTFGQLGNCLMGLLILPVARNSIWTITLGFSWERMIETHIWLGYMYLGTVMSHMLCWWKVYAEKGFFPHDILAVPMFYPDNSLGSSTPCADDFTIPLSVVTFFISLIIFGVLTYPTIRRNHFEVFYYSHHFFLVVWLVQLWHASSAWYYITGGIGFWFIDRILRFTNGSRNIVGQAQAQLVYHPAPVGIDGGAAVTEIFIPNAPGTVNTFEAGQFAFLNIPMLDMLEWHPFTISSSPCDSFTTFHIKNMAPGTGQWTDRLANLAKQHASGLPAEFNVIVDKAYGHPINHQIWDKVILVAGGIGITPQISMFRQFYYEHKASPDAPGADQPDERLFKSSVDLVWTSKSTQELELFKSTLEAVDTDNDPFSYHLFASRETGPGPRVGAAGDEKGDQKGDPELAYGSSEFYSHITKGSRPVFDELLTNLVAGTYDRKAVIVHSCGPQSLCDDLSAVCIDMGIAYSHEYFEL